MLKFSQGPRGLCEPGCPWRARDTDIKTANSAISFHFFPWGPKQVSCGSATASQGPGKVTDLLKARVSREHALVHTWARAKESGKTCTTQQVYFSETRAQEPRHNHVRASIICSCETLFATRPKSLSMGGWISKSVDYNGIIRSSYKEWL